jgi:hemerythrin
MPFFIRVKQNFLLVRGGISENKGGKNMWKDSYLIGVEPIDEQHKNLFKTVKALRDNLSEAEQLDYKKHLMDTLVFLKEYCVNHFKEEEAYQQKVGFAGCEAHKKLHERLVADVISYVKELKETDFSIHVIKRFIGFLSTWLIYHVAGEDQQIPKGAKPAPKAELSKDFYIDFADKIKTVLNVFSGLPEKDMRHFLGGRRHVKPSIVYTVGLINAKANKGVALIYSREIAAGILKTITSLELMDNEDMAYSVLQEVSNIISAHLTGLLSEPYKIPVDIETPKPTPPDKTPDTSDSFLIQTALGDMEVVVY